MRVLLAPDSFGDTLTAAEAARAMAEGWSSRSPDDELTLRPMADGGPGFVDVLHESVGGTLLASNVTGPLGDTVPVTMLLSDDTVYIESAQACGLHLSDELAPWDASSRGVGEAILEAVRAGATTIVIGLGGSATTDGGAGALAALGASADVPLDAGPAGLDGLSRVDITAVRKAIDGVELIAATDVDSQLLGMFGAARVFGPQKGLSEADIIHVDRILDDFVEAVCGSSPSQRRPADIKGAGAAGGLGFALLALGASPESGIDLVARAIGLPQEVGRHDLVVTGEGAFDHSSGHGKVVHGVAEYAAAAARPCIVLAGQASIGSRETRAMGVESAYAMVDLVGEQESFREPAASLSALARRVARTWSRD